MTGAESDSATTVREQMNPELPSIAVIIPCWNAEKWIARAIQSVLDQNYPRLEVIVIDDGSTDGSLDVIRSFGDKVRWETGPNRGACAARNRGMEISDADYLLFLDADDRLRENSIITLSRAVAASDGKIDMVFSATRVVFEGDRNEAFLVPALSATRSEMVENFLSGLHPQTSSVLWRSQFLRRIGSWREDLPRSQDVEVALRALLSGGQFLNVQAVTADYNQRDDVLRISSRSGDMVYASVLQCFEDLLTVYPQTDLGVSRAFARRFYGIARRCFQQGAYLTGRKALRRSRSLGYKGHTGYPMELRGSLAHVVMALIFGLELKESLASNVRSFRAGLRFQNNLLRPSRRGERRT